MKRISKQRKIVAVVAVFLTLIAWGLWENTALTVTEYEITSCDLPESFSGFRIAQISDLHNASFGKDNEKLLSMLWQSSPDIIVITGDFIDSRRTDVNVARSFARAALEIAPVFYVTGNHEGKVAAYWDLKADMEKAGVEVLENERVQIHRGSDSITVIGVNVPIFTSDNLLGDETLERTWKPQELCEESDGYTILLSHHAELFDTYAQSGVDLIFSGHSHGGQFRLPGIGGLFAPGQGFFPKYDGGIYSEGAVSMVVSRGLGNSLIPIRIFNRPEIVIATLRTIPEYQR